MKKNSGTMTNPFHCGHAAQMGVSAALLARNGFTADDEIFGGQYGYGEMMTPGEDYTPESITDPDVEWAVLDNGFKPYPSGVVTHAAMEGLRTISNREALEPGDVASITAEVDERVTDTIDESNPQNAQEARGSYEFCLAAILREGDAGINEFTDEYVNETRTRDQMKKVAVRPVTELFDEGSAEASYGSRVTVECTDGTEYTESVPTAPGSPNNPLSESRLRSKFFECAETGLSKERAELLEETIMALESETSLSDFAEQTLPS
jgi:2-methylcitrate dehydratase PrpD